MAQGSPLKTVSDDANNAAAMAPPPPLQPVPVAPVGVPMHVAPGAHGALLPQQIEDAMSTSQLIDGFSLQSLLKDVPMVGV